MKKKILALAIAALMCVTMLPIAGIASGVEPEKADGVYCATVSGGNIYYNYTDDGNLAVVGADDGVTKVIIPDVIEGENGFMTLIDHGAFLGASYLTEASVPQSVKLIGEFAFASCPELEKVTLEEGVEVIESYAFSSSPKLSQITLPNGLKNIGNNAFARCTGLKSINIPATVSEIGEHPFDECTSLEAITVAPESEYYFNQDGGLYSKNVQKISEAGEIYYTGVVLIAFPQMAEDDIFYIADGTKSIGARAFSYNGKLKKVIIPNSVKTIGFGAFSYCANLESIEIPSSVKKMPEGLFAGSEKLTSVTLPNGLGNIGNGAFFGCESLPSIVIPESVTEIENHSFTACTSLKYVKIPANVDYLGFEAFANCQSLEWVSIPKKVDYISGRAFDGCTSLTDIYYEGTKAEWEAVDIDWGNSPVYSATIHYNSTGPEIAPQPVTITSITSENGAVTLAWDESDYADGYRVYRKTGTGKWTTILSSTTATTFTDSTVTPGKTYSYTVRSFIGSSFSADYTNTAKSITVPSAVEPKPVNITSIKCENGAVVLAWAAQDGVDGYRLYKKVGSGKWTTAAAATTATSYTDTAVEVGKTYSYTLRSFVGSNYSTGYNDTAKSIKVTAAPVEPRPIEITSISCENGAVVLAWAGQDGVDGYRLYKKVGTGKWTTALASTTAMTFTDTAVEVGKTYSYTVRSFVGSTYSTGYNDTAKSIKVTAAAVEPQPIEITSIKCVNGAVELAWAGQDGVDGYRVHKKTGSGKWTTAVAATTETSYTDTAVEVGKKYTYSIRSFVGSTYSTGYNDTAKTITVTAAALEPQPVEISGIGYTEDGSVVLEWIPSFGAESYRVHKKTGAGKWTTVCASTTDTCFTDHDVEYDMWYTYTVRSCIGGVYSTGYNETAKKIRTVYAD
ncbi:MAG: leucine-rich repeat protein [Clostridia bacterium]|nr:leucine-rich repeat protein [Clostridia bacterium]